jgi:preprotein translocase subunit SecG
MKFWKEDKEYTKNEMQIMSMMLIGGFLITIIVLTPWGNFDPQVGQMMTAVLIFFWASTILMFISIEGKATRRAFQNTLPIEGKEDLK